MPTDVIMPKLGLTMETGTVQRWLAAEGQLVEAGTALLEVETDKVVVEVESPASGTLGLPVVREGENVAIGTVLARIYAPGERQADTAAGERPGVAAAEASPA
jgi:pyruvate/2-oxoglutarate dehydrogenase complex dihydrolipoamide acyltransferase (E2) component